MRYALGILVVVAGILALVWVFQRSLIYLPSRGPVPPAGETIEGARDVTLRTSDDLELGAWFVPARAEARSITVLVASGNAGNRTLRAPLAEVLADEGFDVLLFDYRGYGENPGRPSEDGLGRDVRAAYSFLATNEDIPLGRIILFGESLGAAVVTELATEHPPGGLVLRSPFRDLTAIGRLHYPFLPVGLLLRDRYPLEELLAQVEVPTAVVFGTRDSIVPAEQSRSVAEAAGGEVIVVPIEGADHNDAALLFGRELIDATIAVAEAIGPPD